MQVRHAELSAPQSTQFLTEPCGICHRCAVFPRWFCTIMLRLASFLTHVARKIHV